MSVEAWTDQNALSRVADVLGVPVESFLDDTNSERLGGVLECLQLWQEIESDAGRQRALDSLRLIALDERTGDTSGAILEAI